MSDAPTFSIVMAAYNSEATIGSAIQSVLRQTCPDFELIIVDSSTDDTASRVRPFLRDKRIRLISQPPLGPSAARNAAIARASGKYVSFLDSDDLWLPHYLETMAATLDADATAAVAYVSNPWILDDATRRIRRAKRVYALSPKHPTALTEPPEEFLRLLLERGNFVFMGVTMHRRVLEEVGTFRDDVLGSEDYELWLRLASHGCRFVRCPSKLVIYRERPGQLSADPRKLHQTAGNVYRIVVEEFDVPEDLRQLAQERMQERARLSSTLDSGHSRRVPRLLRQPYNALSRIRNFYSRPPREIREAFPDLMSAS
jgi:glycosyltransferase involved in cell wall biosynthesis